jgi:hypothetical protein
MAIKYTKIFRSKALKNMPDLELGVKTYHLATLLGMNKKILQKNPSIPSHKLGASKKLFQDEEIRFKFSTRNNLFKTILPFVALKLKNSGIF